MASRNLRASLEPSSDSACSRAEGSMATWASGLRDQGVVFQGAWRQLVHSAPDNVPNLRKGDRRAVAAAGLHRFRQRQHGGDSKLGRLAALLAGGGIVRQRITAAVGRRGGLVRVEGFGSSASGLRGGVRSAQPAVWAGSCRSREGHGQCSSCVDGVQAQGIRQGLQGRGQGVGVEGTAGPPVTGLQSAPLAPPPPPPHTHTRPSSPESKPPPACRCPQRGW